MNNMQKINMMKYMLPQYIFFILYMTTKVLF